MRSVANLPRASGSFLFGNMARFRQDRIGLLEQIYAECGDIGRFRMGPASLVMVSSAELAHQVLIEKDNAFRKSRGLRTYARPLIGNGLLSSDREVHRKQRKLMSSAFQHKRIASYAAVMAGYAEEMQKTWANGATIDVSDAMFRLTLGIVGKTLFDTELAGDASEAGEALEIAMRHTMDQLAAVVHFPKWVPTPRNRAQAKAIARLDKIIYRMIEERRASKKDNGDVLSMLLLAQDEEDGSSMNDIEVRDEAMTLFLAGHETTSNALMWTFNLLAQHPEVRAKLEAELDRVLGGRTPAFEDLMQLPYALQVMQESMRLYPPAYLVGRESIEDVEIGDVKIPKGTIVMVNIWAMHRRADVFPDPMRFDPDRFKPEEMKKIPRSAYVPFGGGSRICIGNHFALMEGQIVLATLAQRLTFERDAANEIELDPLLTLRPRGAVDMTVRRRSVSVSVWPNSQQSRIADPISRSAG